MRLKQLHISLLLGYLVLFWNLGPSLHRADFLGIHFHSGCGSCCHHADHHHSGHWHGHCHSHGSHSHSHFCDHEHHSDPSEDSSSVSPYHDCAFCDFFENFNCVVDSVDFEIAEAPAEVAATLPLVAWSGEPFSATARGPPAA